MSNPPDPERRPQSPSADAPGAAPSESTRPVNGPEPGPAQTVRRVRPARTSGRGGNLLADGTRLVVGDLERGEVYTGTHPGDRVVRRGAQLGGGRSQC